MAELTGVVTSIIFRNEQNGYTVLEISFGNDECTAVGSMPFLSEGEKVTLRGDWSDHPTFGPQLKVTGYDVALPTTLEEIEQYLASGMIKGVGPSTARAIVERFGEQTLEILQLDPARIGEVSGVGQKRAAQIAASFNEQQGMRTTMIFLQKYDISPAYVMRIYKKYEGSTVDVLKQNPYQLVDDIPGIGFLTADRIASRMGMAADSEFRLASGIKFALHEAAMSQGHVYLPQGALLARASDLLDAPQGLLHDALVQLALRREVTMAKGGEEDAEPLVYLPAFDGAEGEVALRLSLLAQQSFDGPPDGAIERFEAQRDIEFSPAQKEAIALALRHGVAVITGGPGTGKTTIINCILTLLKDEGRKALLCAPTGRAAKRMSEATDKEAKTIHRLLEYAPGGDEYAFQKNQEDPLKADMLIVDEMSMVDLFLMRSLLRAVKAGARLVLVGDVDQLPSVGAGQVLGDIIASGAVPVVRLGEIFRQGAQSMIIQNAHRINRGEMPQLHAREGDFFFERRDNMTAAADTAVDLVVRRLPKFSGLDARLIQVLCPMKKGEAGVQRLNQKLQATLNPPDARKRERMQKEGVLREGDRVMQTRNNYQLAWTKDDEQEGLGAFNGDMGLIEVIDTKAHSLTVLFDDGRRADYDDAAAVDIELCYAISIHKSQGSEFPAVVVPVVNGPPMLLTRNLLYTAVTRARQLVVLVGSQDTVARMVGNNRIQTRYSRLAQRIGALGPMMGA